LYIADRDNDRILSLTESGTIALKLQDEKMLSEVTGVAILSETIYTVNQDSFKFCRIPNGALASTDWKIALEQILDFPGAINASLFIVESPRGLIYDVLGGRIYIRFSDGKYAKLLGSNTQDRADVLQQPYGLTVDGRGVAYVSSVSSKQVFSVPRAGGLAHIAGVAYPDPIKQPRAIRNFDDPRQAVFGDLGRVWADRASGNLYIVDGGKPSVVWKMPPGGGIEAIALLQDMLVQGESGEELRLTLYPRELVLVPGKSLFLAESRSTGGRILEIPQNGTPRVIRGSGALKFVSCFCLDSQNRPVFLDAELGAIYRIEIGKVFKIRDITAVLSDWVSQPDYLSFTMDGDGRVYLSNGDEIIRLDEDGERQQVAGEGSKYFSGTTRDQRFKFVNALAFSPEGDLFILDRDQVKLLGRADLERL
jgi:hypothetical protein